jgi:putative peptide zinc metalloprotease protein
MVPTDPHPGNEAAGPGDSPAEREDPANGGSTVPERPQLAPNVELVGEMQHSGFEDRQWLVQRDGRFIQLTELLYRVAERANGEQTLEEIALGVTEATDWMVSAADVRQLIQTKLIPMGLIIPADGSPVPDLRDRGRSPLALGLRTRAVGPDGIDPIARVLQFLYAPAVLIPVLVVVAVAHAWLYLIHGVGAAVQQVVYTPGLMALVLVLLLVAAVFHEFGHASALRYGGGRARGMGMGIYLIYPAFYTDTTDSYRLGRWARVRTDLGGFYFHLIFTLGLVGAYLLTGQEFLLFVVLLIDVDIVRQCLPFVRFDGYWALADLTGIPDLFSQMGPFLRSMLPVPGWEGSRLPALKPWVKAVFAGYVVLAIPALLALFFLLMRNLPILVANLWASFLNQSAEFFEAWSSSDFPTLAAALSQMLILVLAMVGIAYLLYVLAQTLVTVGWKLSKPTPARRVAGTLIGAGIIATAALLWAPHLPFVGQGPPTGVKTFEVGSRAHVKGPVSYPQRPPVGGNHASVWQDCGFYSTPVTNENAVHSLEHGAVWISYQPDLPQKQVDSLRQLAQGQTYVLVSPYPGLPAPLVASAWGHQLRLGSAYDPRLEQFVGAFRLGSQAPESGEPCTGGKGTPE